MKDIVIASISILIEIGCLRANNSYRIEACDGDTDRKSQELFLRDESKETDSWLRSLYPSLLLDQLLLHLTPIIISLHAWIGGVAKARNSQPVSLQDMTVGWELSAPHHL